MLIRLVRDFLLAGLLGFGLSAGVTALVFAILSPPPASKPAAPIAVNTGKPAVPAPNWLQRPKPSPAKTVRVMKG